MYKFNTSGATRNDINNKFYYLKKIINKYLTFDSFYNYQINILGICMCEKTL